MSRFASILVALAIVPGSALAQYAQVDGAVQEVTPRMVEIRHHLHQYPELGNREFETAKLIAEQLRALGFDEVRTGVAHTGVVGILRGGRPGPVVAVRADMDALPVTEATPFLFKSTQRTTYAGQDVGVSHACGHDIHMAVQLGLAGVLASLRDELPGTVVFIFQPAEEGPPPGERGGAELMVELGVLESPRPAAIFGLHTFWNMEVGKVGYTPGPALAAADHFWITIKGKGAHGASPDLAADPVVMAAQAVTALQTIRSRNLSPMEPGVLTVGLIQGGTRFNIIPDEVRMEGTVRSYSVDVQDLVERRMHEILAGVTSAGGGTYELTYDRGIPVTVNDVALTERMVPSLERALGTDNVVRIQPATVAEDFSYFANVVPGLYFRLGTLAPGGSSGNHHTPTFQADDGAIPVGITSMAYLVWDFLSAKQN
ncbi:MAG: amidohydrolase [Gemmatimonadota bacterium]|nr:amidohydrolase [Gemmatimonadota bacterium]MDH3369310.1 amidohydrolase [Gemmatimonadota bacterium]MDH3478539.1 amidohydrolase [Gemmatimonadota bacterium]MDH3571035.1 amidohydrolase [Gemmatimonadota bacterium]MDH5549695.1 amidohydrolase [Gemmatimonadota bacterium]